MAVPKKRTSRSKKNIRKAQWKRGASQQTKKALALAISLLNKAQVDRDESARVADDTVNR